MTATVLAPTGLILILALAILLIVLLIRGTRTAGRAPGGAAIQMLEERYVRGEITRDEFLERRDVLGGR